MDQPPIWLAKGLLILPLCFYLARRCSIIWATSSRHAHLESAIEQTYGDGTLLPIDQGGQAGTEEFVQAISERLPRTTQVEMGD